MHPLWVGGAILSIILGWPVFNNEKDRYTHALHNCMDTFVKNQHTLALDVCASVERREQCSDDMRLACLKAERENRITPADCARQQWFTQSEVVALYQRLAGSSWTVLALAIVTILGSMYFWVQYKTTENSHRRMIDVFRQPSLYSIPRRNRDDDEYYYGRNLRRLGNDNDYDN